MLSSSISLCIGFFAFYYLNRIFKRLKLSRRIGLAIIAEQEAEELLKKHKFRIIDRQRRADIITYVDGRPNISTVKADYIVEKRGKYYVAEVKAGEAVSNPTEPSTRRQLLEYNFAYQPDGLILVDMIENKLHYVDFLLPEKGEDRVVKIGLILLVTGVIIGLLWLFVSIKIL